MLVQKTQVLHENRQYVQLLEAFGYYYVTKQCR